MNNANFKVEEKAILQDLKELMKGLLGDRVRLILYGSRARGDYDDESDIDIAIIVRGLRRKEKSQILDRVADIELKYLTPLATLVFAEDDFESLKKRERRIALDIEKEGIPL